MQADPSPARSTMLARLFIDVPVTLAAWSYYIFAFLLFFAPCYGAAFVCPRRRPAFQQMVLPPPFPPPSHCTCLLST